MNEQKQASAGFFSFAVENRIGSPLQRGPGRGGRCEQWRITAALPGQRIILGLTSVPLEETLICGPCLSHHLTPPFVSDIPNLSHNDELMRSPRAASCLAGAFC